MLVLVQQQQQLLVVISLLVRIRPIPEQFLFQPLPRQMKVALEHPKAAIALAEMFHFGSTASSLK